MTGVKLLFVSLILILGAFAVIRPAGATVSPILTASGNIEVLAGAPGHTTLTFSNPLPPGDWSTGALISCIGLPTGAGFSVSPSNPLPGPISASESFQLTVSTSSSTPPGTYPVTCGAAHPVGAIISPSFEVSSRGLSNGGGSLGPQSISIQQLQPTFDLIVDPAAIPEYPFGLAVLAIFMIISYGLIRRRTVTRQPN